MRRVAAWLLPLLIALPLAAEKPLGRGQFDLYEQGLNKGRERYRIMEDKKKDRWYIISDLFYKLPFPQAKRGYINYFMYPEYYRSIETSQFVEFKYRMKVQDFSDTDIVEADQSATEVIDQDRTVYDFTEVVNQGTEDVMKDHVDFGVNAGSVAVSGETIRFKATKVNVTRTKDEVLKGRLAIIEPMVPSVYIPLLDQLTGEGPYWEFGIALPQYLKYRPGRVEYQGIDQAVVRGVTYLLKHYDVKIQGSHFSSFWVDRAGQVVQVSVPKDGLIAIRADYKPQAFERAEPRVVQQVIETQSPFTETRITVPCGAVTLGATLTTPQGTGPFPTALLVQDLGAVDRDGNTPGGERTGEVKQLAFVLAEKGIATLRWDSRGVGASGGDAETSALAEKTEEVRALSAWLKASPAVRPEALFVLATGLGAWATLEAGPELPVAGYVFVGYPGKPVLRLWKEQASVLPDAAALKKAYQDLESLEVALSGTADWVPYRGGRRYIPSVRTLAAVEPLTLLRGSTKPALLAFPDKDLVVQPFHREIVAPLLGPAQKSILLPDVDHYLVQIDPENGRTSVVDKRAVGALADWILERAKTTP